MANNPEPLELCCKRWDIGAASVAQTLLRGVEEERDLDGYMSSLFKACAFLSFDVISVLVMSPFFPLSCERKTRMGGIDGVTLVMVVCTNRIAGWRAVELVLSKVSKSLVKEKNSRHDTALRYACLFGNHDIVSTARMVWSSCVSTNVKFLARFASLRKKGTINGPSILANARRNKIDDSKNDCRE